MKVLHIFTLATTAANFFDGQFRYLVDNGHEIHIVASPANIDKFCEYNHTVYYPIDVVRRIDPIADIKTIYSLVKLIKQHKYDAVFGHTPKGAMVAMIASKIAGIKIRVYYRHGLIYTTAKGIKKHIFKTVERLTAFLATRIVNVSPSLSQLAVKDKLNPSRKQLVIGSGTCGGIDALNLFNPAKCRRSGEEIRSSLRIGVDDFVIGFCGRLCKDKGIAELVEAFEELQGKRSDIKNKLLLIGSLDSRDILPDDVKDKLSSNPDIVCTGRIAHQELPDYYAAMDVFVFPSYREGFGMCVIEASAMRIPILVSRSHGCVDSIKEHVTGEYINLDAHDIAQSIERMYDDSERARLGHNGRTDVLEHYDYSVMWPKVKVFYDSLNTLVLCIAIFSNVSSIFG